MSEFLFGSRRGYCEQISTALAVMLRTLHIPAREATGYVPGPYNPISDLYDVQADDAHAWVQVWFPGYGWQSFDPTAEVPLANPSPADALGHDLVGALHRVPLVPVAAVVVGGMLIAAVLRRRRRIPATWARAISWELERAARRAGLPVERGASLAGLAARLDARRPPGAAPATPSATELARLAEVAAYGGAEPEPADRQRLLAAARRLRRAARRWRATAPGDQAATEGSDRTPDPVPVSPGGEGPAPPPSSPRQPAGAGTP